MIIITTTMLSIMGPHMTTMDKTNCMLDPHESDIYLFGPNNSLVD